MSKTGRAPTTEDELRIRFDSNDVDHFRREVAAVVVHRVVRNCLHHGRRRVELVVVEGPAAGDQRPPRHRGTGCRRPRSRGRGRRRSGVEGQVENGEVDRRRRAVVLHLLVTVLRVASVVRLGQRSTVRRYDSHSSCTGWYEN